MYEKMQRERILERNTGEKCRANSETKQQQKMAKESNKEK